MPNDKARSVSPFGLRHSSFFRHWSFDIRHLLFLLLQRQSRQRLGHGNESVAVLRNVTRRAALVCDVLGAFRRRHHINRVPRPPARAARAADAPLQADVPDLLEHELPFTRPSTDATAQTKL